MPQTATKSINLAAGSQPIHSEEIEIDAMVIVIGLSVFMSNGIGRTCRDADMHDMQGCGNIHKQAQ